MDTTQTDEESSQLAMIDTHCHLDDAAFAVDLDAVLASSRAAGVTAWVLIGYAPERWNSAAALACFVPGMMHSLGVHPSHSQEWSPEVEAALREKLVSTGAVAVGEFGLDFYRDNAPFEVQREAMVGQLRVARDLGLPAIFHMRDAEAEVLEILRAEDELPGMIFHAFDGTSSLTDFILERNAYVGVGGLATRRKSDPLREQLRRIPLERIVLETDSPYLVPARQKDRRNVPAHVRTVAVFLSEFLGIPLEEIVHQTTHNAETVFGRPLL